MIGRWFSGEWYLFRYDGSVILSEQRPLWFWEV